MQRSLAVSLCTRGYTGFPVQLPAGPGGSWLLSGLHDGQNLRSIELFVFPLAVTVKGMSDSIRAETGSTERGKHRFSKSLTIEHVL